MYQPPARVYLAWVPTSGGNIPPNAVVGGRDNSSREDIYIGRFQHNNDYIPGKALRSHKCTYVPYGGKEVPSSNYEILVSDDQSILRWIPESGGRIPEHSVQGGFIQSGEPLYIARARAPDGGMCVGKLHRSHKCCYIPWGGKEHAQQSYEVLTFP